MPIIKHNDIIDVIYDKICGYEPEEAYKILELYHCKRLIPIEWVDSYCTDCSIDLRDNNVKAIKMLLEDWKKENEG